MSNDYFDNADYTAAVKSTQARAATVNAIAQAVEAGFDKLPGELALKQNRVTYVTASGTNSYAVTLSPAPSSLVEGLSLRVRFTNANTAAATLNVNSLGAVSIISAGAALASGDIEEDAILDLVYDGTNFRIMASGLASSSGGGEP